MGSFGAWMRRLGARIGQGVRGFMAGRYGTDQLSVVTLCVSFVLVFVAMFVRLVPVYLLLTLTGYGLMIWVIFRTLSRNTYKRYQENRRMLLLFSRLRDRQHRYYTCPKCRQTVRVPSGKGLTAKTKQFVSCIV